MRHEISSVSSLSFITIMLITAVTKSQGSEDVVLPYATVIYSGTRAVLHSNSRRSIAGMVYTLSQELGIPLTFEDAPIMFTGDFDDITVSGYHGRFPADRLLVPKGGPLDIEFLVSRVHGPPLNVQATLSALLNAHSRAGYPGIYGIRQQGTVWHIIPLESRDSLGNLVHVTPLMDTVVHVRGQKGRTNSEVLDQIIDLVYRSRNRHIFIGTNLSHDYLAGITDEEFDGTVREWLESTFDHARGHALWILNCTPVGGPCALNIY